MEKVWFVRVLVLLFGMFLTMDALAFDHFHCKAATCHEFYYRLRRFGRQIEFAAVCRDTVHALQGISQKYGKCFDETAQKINPGCIHALAMTIKRCINGLNGVPENYARYHCGYRLMQNCAKNVGLDRFSANLEHHRLDDDDDD